jgi:hypothetical protein
MSKEFRIKRQIGKLSRKYKVQEVEKSLKQIREILEAKEKDVSPL